MAFIHHFLIHAIVAGITCFFWFTIPGLLILRALRWDRRFTGALAVLVAPSLGLCAFGAFSLPISVWRFSRGELIGAWIAFNLLAWIADRRSTNAASTSVASPPRLGKTASWLLPLACALFGVMVAQTIFPAVLNGGMYLDDMMLDHAKIAISDGIAREGIPPINPYYAPDGHTIPLSYYYLWHFVASQPIVLEHVTGWEADVGITWLTAFATIGLLVAIGVELTGRAAVGGFILVMACVSQISEPLLRVLFPAYPFLVQVSDVLITLWLQCAWVPQHVTSACAVVLAMMLIADIADLPALGRAAAVSRVAVLGFFAATAVGASFWVGGIATAGAVPFMIAALVAARIGRSAWISIARTAIFAAPIAFACALPVLRGPFVSPAPVTSPVKFEFWPASFWIPYADPIDPRLDLIWKPAHFLLWWVQFLPLTLGVIVLAGFPAVVARSVSTSPGGRALRLLAGFSAVGYLLVAEFMKSVIFNNDLGWRAPLVPTMLLSVWGAAALMELRLSRAVPPMWNARSIFMRLRWLLLPVAWAALILGLISTVVAYRSPWFATLVQDETENHRLFLVQDRAWREARRFAAPTQRVQANPDGFLDIVMPGDLPQALFSDRPTAYASVIYATTYAYAQDMQQNSRQYRLIHHIFQGKPRPGDIKSLRYRLHVRVVLVNRNDPLWRTRWLERSHYYRLAVRRKDYRIYVARGWRDSDERT